MIVCWLIVLSTKPPVRPAHAAQAGFPAPPQLRVSPAVSTEGYFVLEWSTSGAEPLILQESASGDFSSAARERQVPGTGALTLSGFEDGIYHFRAGAAGGPWSEPVTVEVRHHALGRAFGWFLLGLALFVVLCASIVLGHRANREHADAA